MPPVPGSRVGERGCSRSIHHLQRSPDRPAVAVILQGRVGLGQPSDLPKATPWWVCRVSGELQYPHPVSPPEGRAQADRRERLLSDSSRPGTTFPRTMLSWPRNLASAPLCLLEKHLGAGFQQRDRRGPAPHRPTHAHSPHPALRPVSPPPPCKRPVPNSRLLGGS